MECIISKFYRKHQFYIKILQTYARANIQIQLQTWSVLMFGADDINEKSQQDSIRSKGTMALVKPFDAQNDVKMDFL